MIRKVANLKLQAYCARKRWVFTIGKHCNVFIYYSRYPLEGVIDLGDFSKTDFKKLALFFDNRSKNSKVISENGKWSFSLNKHYSLIITFKHYPFDGLLELGEMSRDNCEALSELFTKAQGI